MLPENFDRLHAGEEHIREMSKASIEASCDLTLHTKIIEAAMSMVDYVAKANPHRNDDDLVIKMLAARLFNGSASALRLLMAGYYQSSVMAMRDLLETTFLLDYFYTFPEQVTVWKSCDERKRLKDFGAARIRIALDDRDGFTERKREAAYSLLCELGTHPTYRGFQLLQRQGSDLVHVGPFFDEASLGATLAELAKIMMQAGNQGRFIDDRKPADFQAIIAYMKTQMEWSTRFFGYAGDTTKLAEVEAILEKIVLRSRMKSSEGKGD